VIAGEGLPLFVATLQQQAHRLGIEADVIWTGFLAGEDKWGALAAADIFVLPSHSENFGMAVVEAMAVGRPVIVTDQVGIHSAIADADAGLIAPCEVSALADALVLLATDTEGRMRLGKNGQVLTQEQFSLSAVTTSLLHLYTNIRNERACSTSL
jgi:glycosyltransferase involved in cell wall biosynthesis